MAHGDDKNRRQLPKISPEHTHHRRAYYDYYIWTFSLPGASAIYRWLQKITTLSPSMEPHTHLHISSVGRLSGHRLWRPCLISFPRFPSHRYDGATSYARINPLMPVSNSPIITDGGAQLTEDNETTGEK